MAWLRCQTHYNTCVRVCLEVVNLIFVSPRTRLLVVVEGVISFV